MEWLQRGNVRDVQCRDGRHPGAAVKGPMRAACAGIPEGDDSPVVCPLDGMTRQCGAEASTAPSSQVLVARQPLFDPGLNVAAYELLYRSGTQDRANVTNAVHATANVRGARFPAPRCASLQDCDSLRTRGSPSVRPVRGPQPRCAGGALLVWLMGQSTDDGSKALSGPFFVIPDHNNPEGVAHAERHRTH